MRGHMEVDFNGVRKQAIDAYERLVKTLNASISCDEHEEFRIPNYNPDLKETTYWPHVSVRTSDIQSAMDDLRRSITLIGVLIDTNDPNVKDVLSEMFPLDPNIMGGRGPSMTVFNPEEE